MQLKLKRSQRSGGLMGGKVVFGLTAQIALKPDEEELVRKYGLAKQTVYDSEARKKHQDAADFHADYTQVHGQSRNIGKALYGLGRMAASAGMAALSLHVTIESLMKGQHIETKSLDELIVAEGAIIEACQRVRSYLDTAATFNETEQVIEI
jgi:hypothetical protein